jgi:hypothetical protein
VDYPTKFKLEHCTTLYAIYLTIKEAILHLDEDAL